MGKKIKEQIFYVKGMHCPSCEILIEKKLLKIKNIKSVEASAPKNEVLIEFENEKPTLEKINKIFKKEGYVFSEKREKTKEVENGFNLRDFLISLSIGLLIIIGFIGLNKLGLGGLVNISSKSSLPMFFLFGLLAGISTCTALIGGIILSMSKQWYKLYSQDDSSWKKIQPHILFNAGRFFSYGILGGALGALGSKFSFSLKFGPFLVIVISIIMIFLALQMLGFKVFRKFQFTMPRFISRFIATESNFKGYNMPFLMGGLTFFLPCGFTITVQGLALISGSALQGSLIMLSFVAGTFPMLFLIGLSSVKFLQKPYLSEKFLKVAGILVLFFAFYNINSQLNVLGFSNISNLRNNFNYSRNFSKNNSSQTDRELVPIINGKQILKMEAFAYNYSPNYFKVRKGIPVRWEITDKGTSGCTNAIISKNLFEGEISLTPSEVNIKEFTPQVSGKYKFSCWMGMVWGIIEVVDEDNFSEEKFQNYSLQELPTPSETNNNCSCCQQR